MSKADGLHVNGLCLQSRGYSAFARSVLVPSQGIAVRATDQSPRRAHQANAFQLTCLKQDQKLTKESTHTHAHTRAPVHLHIYIRIHATLMQQGTYMRTQCKSNSLLNIVHCKNCLTNHNLTQHTAWHSCGMMRYSRVKYDVKQ